MVGGDSVRDSGSSTMNRHCHTMSIKTLVSRISGMEEAIHNSLQDFLPSFELKIHLTKSPYILRCHFNSPDLHVLLCIDRAKVRSPTISKMKLFAYY